MKAITPILLCVSFQFLGHAATIPDVNIDGGLLDTVDVSWHGEDSHVYFLQFSDNLEEWFYCPEIREGFDETIAYGCWSDSPRLFFRVQFTDQAYSNPLLDDFDSDGIANWIEVELMNSNPLLPDSDGDGTGDASQDSDSDGISDLNEALWGVSSIFSSDSDGDGLDDATELALGLNPLLADTDGDGVDDNLDMLGLVANENIPADSTPSTGPGITILSPGVTSLP